jgi:hypothetical protein
MSRGLIKIAGDRDAWKLILKGATTLHGPQCQWRERTNSTNPVTLSFLYTDK